MGAARRTLQLTARLTSSAMRFSSAFVSLVSANAVGHMLPSSRFALSLKPIVAYRALNFAASWKKQMTSCPRVSGHAVPGARGQARRALHDDRVDLLGHGAVGVGHLRDRCKHDLLAFCVLQRILHGRPLFWRQLPAHGFRASAQWAATPTG